MHYQQPPPQQQQYQQYGAPPNPMVRQSSWNAIQTLYPKLQLCKVHAKQDLLPANLAVPAHVHEVLERQRPEPYSYQVELKAIQRWEDEVEEAVKPSTKVSSPSDSPSSSGGGRSTPTPNSHSPPPLPARPKPIPKQQQQKQEQPPHAQIDPKVQEFCSITAASPADARAALDKADGDLNDAIRGFFEG